jgi:hypothetical protein
MDPLFVFSTYEIQYASSFPYLEPYKSLRYEEARNALVRIHIH